MMLFVVVVYCVAVVVVFFVMKPTQLLGYTFSSSSSSLSPSCCIVLFLFLLFLILTLTLTRSLSSTHHCLAFVRYSSFSACFFFSLSLSRSFSSLFFKFMSIYARLLCECVLPSFSNLFFIVVVVCSMLN